MKALLLPAVLRAADDPDVRVLVFTGTGRAFCAGQDLKEHLHNMSADPDSLAHTVTGFYNPLISAVTGMRKPVLAAVNGVAAGAGAALAFACDLRLAASSSSFTMAFAGVALSADSGSSFTLPRLIGHGRATRMMLLGEKVGAAEALRIGMVDEVVDDDAFAARTAELAATLAARADNGLRLDQAVVGARGGAAIWPEPSPSRTGPRRPASPPATTRRPSRRSPRSDGPASPADPSRKPNVAFGRTLEPCQDRSANSVHSSTPACATSWRSAAPRR